MHDAPPPRYTDSGVPLGSWTLHAGYDEAADVLYLAWQTPGSRWHKSTHRRETFPATEVEDLVARATILVRTFGARRLF